jgi:hypothetical protein
VYGGAGGTNSHTLAAGWQTISGRLTAAQVVADTRGPFMRLTQTSADIYVSWVEVSLNPPVESGVYTPTLSEVTNVFGFSAFECQYMRVGDTVTVSGRADIEQRTAGTSNLGITLPIASNLAGPADCAGTALNPALDGVTGIIVPDPINEIAWLQFKTSTQLTANMYFIFAYRVKP